MPRPDASSPIFCYVTDRASLARPALREMGGGGGPERRENTVPPEFVVHDDPLAPLLAAVAAAAAAGVHWIQLREKDLPAKDLARLTRAAIARCNAAKRSAEDSSYVAPRIFVNDRLDVAIVEGAGGVHLGESSLPVAEAKRLLQNPFSGPHNREFLAGVSCHSLASAQAAADAGADYLFFGPIFPTPSKHAYGPAQGLPRLAEVCRAVSIPVLAIGGINAENAKECLASGAAGIAAIRLFQQPNELQAVAGLLRSRPCD